MFGLGTLQLAGVAAIIVGLATGGAYLKGRSDGFVLGAAKGVSATMDQLEKRGQINEAVRKTGECDLIIELGGSCTDGVPVNSDD